MEEGSQHPIYGRRSSNKLSGTYKSREEHKEDIDHLFDSTDNPFKNDSFDSAEGSKQVRISGEKNILQTFIHGGSMDQPKLYL